jgi:hypothetical protein
MRKQPSILYQIYLILIIFFSATSIVAQSRYATKSPTGESDFELTIRNVAQTSDRILEFDIYLQDTDEAQDFELATVQAGILLSSAIFEGGSMSAVIVSGTSTLNTLQNPTNINFSTTVSGNPGLSLIKLAPRGAPGAGNGTIISKVSPGDRVIRLRLTSTVAFAANSTANLIFTSSAAINPLYATRVAQYISGINTQLTVTPGVNAIVLENPVLNPAAISPTAFDVTGGGAYCQGSDGLPVGLSGSEVDVTYTLYKDAIAQVPTVSGTGSAISFGDQLAGIYTLSGTSTGGTTDMTGSAVITETANLPVSVGLVTDANNVCTGTEVTLTANPENGGSPTYQWYKNAAPAGTNQATYSYTPENNDQVYVVLTSDLTCVSGNPATSNTITLLVNDQLAPAVNIVADANPVTAGTLVTFTPTPVNGGTPSYQWYVNGGLVGGGDTYAYVPANDDQVYVVLITSLTCVTSATATSNTITMTVNPVVPATTTWTGAVNSDWFNPGNWGNGVPGAITQVTIPGGLTNYPTLDAPATIAGVTINSGGSFIGSEFLTTASALVKRDIVNSVFHFISSPVASTTFGEVFPFNQTEVWVRQYNETTGDWDNLTSADAPAVGKGYTVQMNQPQTALFEGVLNNSPVTLTLVKQNPGTDPSRVGWNLLGNPFTSAIDWDLTDHSNVDGAVYVWNGTQYVSWNGSIGALTDGIIPAQNAFFAKTVTDGLTLNVPLSARVHSSQAFYKATIADMLEITAEGNSYSDKTFVRFNNMASSDFDSQYDAYKLTGNINAPQLFSLINGDTYLSINELPMAGNEVVDLGFSCNTTGIYTIAAAGAENFASSVPVILQDVKLNTYQDLKTNPLYSFGYEAGENVNRFKLWFQQVTGINSPVINNLKVYSFDKTVVIENNDGLTGEVGIYDITGRAISSQVLTNQSTTQIPVNAAGGTYIVKIITANGPVNAKVFIR